jgi:CRISPR-associated endonuclease/helicase Cas3
MGPGLATSAQLTAFREGLGVAAPCATLWMSATLRPEWLATVDFREAATHLHSLALSAADRRDDRLRVRLEAPKRLHRAAKVPG